MIPARRSLLGQLGGIALLSRLPAAACAATAAPGTSDLASLSREVRAVVARASPNYELWRQSLIWQRRKSPRYPDVIVQADSVQEVAAAVRYARSNRLPVTTRCGGHSMSASFLRDDGMLIDVSRLRGIDIRPARLEVDVGPGVIARELNARLGAVGLAFPTAHCGMVPVGGYLLGGGLGLNGDAWGGMATFNIVAAEVVTADGEVRTVSPTENAELYWAIRGGGPGLFCVVTRLHLQAYSLPRAIVGNTYTFRLEDIEAVVLAMLEIGPHLARNVEFLAYLGAMPEELVARSGPNASRLSISVDANAYSDSRAAARWDVHPLASHPVVRRAVGADIDRESTIEQLYFNEELGFGQRRWSADNVMTNRPHDVASLLKARMPACPARDAQAVLLYKGRSLQMPDAACSVVGQFYASYYMLWDDPTEDAVMMAFLQDLYREMAPLGIGCNINEMNQEGRPDGVRTCYSPDAWRRLAELRAKWDPQGVFQGFYGQSA